MITFAYTGDTFQTRRLVDDLQGDSAGPTLVFVGGIHGNEPSGVIAIKRMFDDLRSRKVAIRGRLIGLVGNMGALAANRRYLSRDLNRVWDQEFFSQYQKGDRFESSEVAEYREACEIFDIVAPLLPQKFQRHAGTAKLSSSAKDKDPKQKSELYLFDLHTTSAPTVPFIAMNDQISNRKFALQFPVPTVLGIEEYLKGPLLSYINDFGPVAFAFEAGQHDDPSSTEIHLSFIYMAMVHAGVISADQIPDFSRHQTRLAEQGRGEQGITEVIHRHAIEPGDHFQMEPGFRNFTAVKKGQVLAKDRNGPITARKNAKIFLPLYQASGDDGFFIVRPVPRLAMNLSTFLRRINFENLLVLLPGISRSKTEPDALVVNRRIARFLANEIFHLLGYRRKKADDTHLTFVRREVG